jgi:hypothetical protein
MDILEMQKKYRAGKRTSASLSRITKLISLMSKKGKSV